jgi:hypothetical protein
MDSLLQFRIPVIVAVVSGIIILFIEYRIGFIKRSTQEQREVASKAIAEAQVNFARQVLSSLPESTLNRYIQYLVYSQRPDGSFPEPLFVISPSLDSTEVEKLVEAKQSALQQRLEEIENRFPREATLEKIASVNDAILATNLESIVETVKRLEDKVLTRWDVAKVVFEILAAVGVLVGIVSAVIGFFTKGGP